MRRPFPLGESLPSCPAAFSSCFWNETKADDPDCSPVEAGDTRGDIQMR